MEENKQQLEICRFNVQTPGKIILSGEHSVVYGKPALVMAINLYTHASVSVNRLSEKSTIEDLQIEFDIKSD